MRHHQRELPLSISFPSNKTASIHPSFLFHPHIHHLNNFIHHHLLHHNTFPSSPINRTHHRHQHVSQLYVYLPPTNLPGPIALGEEKRREENTQKQQLIHLPSDLPPVKPSAIALGTLFNHAASLAVLGPVFGDTYRRAMQANSNEEFFKSKEAASAGAAWGTSLIGSAVQSYGVGALINATGTLSYKGAAYLGALIFAASSAPSVRPFHHKFPSHH